MAFEVLLVAGGIFVLANSFVLRLMGALAIGAMLLIGNWVTNRDGGPCLLRPAIKAAVHGIAIKAPADPRDTPHYRSSCVHSLESGVYGVRTVDSKL